MGRDELRRRAEALARTGLSPRAVARVLGVPSGTVYSWLWRAGLGTPREEWLRRVRVGRWEQIRADPSGSLRPMKQAVALALALVIAACATPTPSPGMRMFLVNVINQSGRPANLVIGWDGMYDGRPIGTVNPGVLPPGTTENVVLGIPPGIGWAIYVNPNANRGPSITWRDAPADASGQMPFSIVVTERGDGAADANPPGWFGNPPEVAP